ncbi:hypothetical protein NJB14197_27260 [Mycobacterium montefiorense]|uniref:Uncharacterized protein n=1 Tax=Mycobacterium montefiorense TaxID=154654 RepID=A0AA37PNW4_9MYCO|nr:hypothetical protein MmonteBS_22670 [Mycobacterium montefiorense]GKU35033.1 hypothetical protein NJB14191_23790 [Mycobacterium montefiorense]GKU41044.1 hypothetical protein NJB14192_30300 [Mycobacterium montefiorense]GKU47155.1 hypothetical protein NJB14194_37730 [Mycobacterium montefiorense]GKU53108.1 hypothetical protein NJB14195_43490 [Mycobacterium montefiorense]
MLTEVIGAELVVGGGSVEQLQPIASSGAAKEFGVLVNGERCEFASLQGACCSNE